MQLSQFTTAEMADVLCELAPLVANITGDKVLLDTLSAKVKTKGMSAVEVYTYGAKKYAQLVPIILKEHRNDVFGILAVLNKTTIETIAAQKITETLNQVKEAVQDKDLWDFFKSWLPEDVTA